MNMLLLMTFIHALTTPTFASQEVIVKAEQSTIHDRPEEASDGLALAKKSTVLKTSSSSRSGWLKVQLPTRIYGKKYGWIKKSDVDPVKVLYPDTKAPSDIDSEQKKKPGS